jgi:hypothetical protein
MQGILEGLNAQAIVTALFSANSIWSIVLRGVLWFAVALIIIVSVDNPNLDSSTKTLKANLGFFFAFIVLSSVLTIFLFDFQA